MGIDAIEQAVTKAGRWKINIAIGILVAAAAFTASWYIWKPAPKVPEVAAPEIRQQDGSLVLEKKPDQTAKAPMQAPKGTVTERSIGVTVKPAKGPDPTTGECPAVKVNLALVRDPKTSLRRVVASSPDGEVVNGYDIPIEDAAPPAKEKPWAAGLAYSTNGKYGGWVDRDLGPWRLGIQINQASDLKGGVEGWAKAGIRF